MYQAASSTGRILTGPTTAWMMGGTPTQPTPTTTTGRNGQVVGARHEQQLTQWAAGSYMQYSSGICTDWSIPTTTCGIPQTIPHMVPPTTTCGIPQTIPHMIPPTATCGIPQNIPHMMPTHGINVQNFTFVHSHTEGEIKTQQTSVDRLGRSICDDQDPPSLYRDQLKQTTEYSKRVRAEIGRIARQLSTEEGANGVCDPSMCSASSCRVLVLKHAYLTAHFGSSKELFQILTATEGNFCLNDFHGDPSDEEIAARNGFYVSAAKLLRNMEVSFQHVLSVGDDTFRQIFAKFKTIIERHPYIVKGGVISGGLVGAFVGAGGQTLFGCPHVYWGAHQLLVTLAAKLGGGAGLVVGLGGISGAAVGLIVAGAIVCLVECAGRHTKEGFTTARKELEATMEQLRQKDDLTTPEFLSELSEQYWKIYVEPVVGVVDEANCPTCLETLARGS